MTARRKHNPNGVNTAAIVTAYYAHIEESIRRHRDRISPQVEAMYMAAAELIQCGECGTTMPQAEAVGGLCKDCDCEWRTGEICPD